MCSKRNNSMKDKANTILHNAYKEAMNLSQNTSLSCKHGSLIDYVISGNHLTYKYVLFNAILSKATDNNINPLCLQVKSKLPGSFDARTICHKVIVPFEQTILKKVLGGSNEPFLNKPARFTELSKTNAVRRGKDANMLHRLCDELPTLSTSEEAYRDLVYLLRQLIILRDQKEVFMNFSIPELPDLPIKLTEFCFDTLNRSFEGESLTLIIAGLYRLLYSETDAKIEVHPVNESGASSKEISDLDIYIKDNLIISNELKDKSYSDSDVRHAADKVLLSGGNKMFFIEGPRGNASSISANLIEEYSNKNFMLVIISYRAFITTIVPLIKNINITDFITFIFESARETKFKQDTIDYINSLAIKHFNLKHN